jgi:hypothetical protein
LQVVATFDLKVLCALLKLFPSGKVTGSAVCGYRKLVCANSHKSQYSGRLLILVEGVCTIVWPRVSVVGGSFLRLFYYPNDSACSKSCPPPSAYSVLPLLSA